MKLNLTHHSNHEVLLRARETNMLMWSLVRGRRREGTRRKSVAEASRQMRETRVRTTDTWCTRVWNVTFSRSTQFV